MTDTTGAAPAGGLAAGLVRAARPHHWVKNVVVAAAPAAAGLTPDGFVLGRVLLAFVALCLAASGTYLLNDVRDLEVDRGHPVKRNRPIASGQVPVSTAVGVGIVLLLAGIAVPLAADVPDLAVVVGLYVAATTAYSLGFKQVAIVELAFVAAGFVLRAAAGAVAVDVPVSRWFLIVVSAGALHLVATKRWAEARDQTTAARRPVLDDYPGDLLGHIRFVTSAVLVMAYVLWAFEAAAATAGGAIWHELSIVPVVLALFRHEAAVQQGAGETPEELLVRDRQIQVFAVLWLALYLAGVYGAAS